MDADFCETRVNQQLDEIRQLYRRLENKELTVDRFHLMLDSAFSQLLYFADFIGRKHNYNKYVECAECGFPDLQGNYEPCCNHTGRHEVGDDNGLPCCKHCGTFDGY